MPAAVVADLAPHPGVLFGCDYNPEQWDRATWIEDMALMREAGIGLVAINIFGWSSINPAPGVWNFEDLDAMMDLLHENGIRVNLGTGTASPPPWLSAAYPEMLPMVEDGTRRYPGGRQAFCPSSPIYRVHAAAVVEAVAQRYGSHPALALWHVSNEIGCHNALCYCDASADAFRAWLQERYTTLNALNDAWGTSFWSQRYSAWDQILTPRAALSLRNPGQMLDFARFSSDAGLALYRAEAEIIRRHSAAPVTTNFMATAHIRTQDYWTWASEMDVVANDHYIDRRLSDPTGEVAFAADLTRGLAGGDPWLLMETSTSAVNWQPYNVAMAPGELLRTVSTHLARGADGICFFQWRASAQGAEKFHSALLPHAGTDSALWRQSVELGGLLDRLTPITRTRVSASTALLFSWESWWALEGEGRPSEALRYLDQVHAAHRALVAAGVTVDVVRPGTDLSSYNLIIVPALHLVRDGEADAIASAAERGASVLITFASGTVNENDRVGLGGYPAAFRDLLGLRVEEFAPLRPDTTVTLSDGTVGSVWSERIAVVDAEVITTFVDGPAQGSAAITRRAHGAGAAWYLATSPDDTSYLALVQRIVAEAGVPQLLPDHGRLDLIRRAGEGRSILFAINHTAEDATITAHGHDLVHQESVAGSVTIPAGGVRIIEESA